MQENDIENYICPNCTAQYRYSSYCPNCGAPRPRRRLDAGTIAGLVVLAVVALAAGAVGTCSMVCTVTFLLAPDAETKDLLIISVPLLLIATAIAVPCVRAIYKRWKRK